MARMYLTSTTSLLLNKRWTLLDDYKEDISWTYSGTTYTLKPESTIWVFPFPKNLMEKNGNFEHNYPVTQN